MSGIGYIDDHVARALDMIPSWISKPHVQAIVRALAQQVQEIEDVLQDLEQAFSLSGATGVWLDYLGLLVGEARIGLSDQDYRRFIEAGILVRRSNGDIPTILEIAQTLTGATDVQYVPAYPAGYLLTIYTPSPVPVGLRDRIQRTIIRATPASVGVAIIEFSGAPSGALRHDVTPGHDGPLMPRAWS